MCFALPVRVLAIADGIRGLIEVDRLGKRTVVSARMLLSSGRSAESLIGKWVTIHQGFAMDIIAEVDALQVLETLQALSDPAAEIDVSEVKDRQFARG